MKAQDIVNRLAADIPRYTDGFSNSVGVLSATVAGTTVTVTTDAPHDLIEGQDVAILGVLAPVQIDTASFIRTGTSATFETLQDHDLTLSQRDISNGGKTITISGATEPEFNGTFQLIKVLNRNKLMINVTDSGPTTISGSPIVEDANGAIFNGLFPATNVTPTTFEYTIPVSYTVDPVVSGASVQSYIRVLSVLDIQQYIQDVYTKKGTTEDCLVVQLGDVVVSKNRNEPTDASSSAAGERWYSPLLIQSFAVYMIMNVTDDLTGSRTRDEVETVYIPAVLKSILRASFDTGFTVSQYRSTFTGHGVFAFADINGKNKALYVHEVTFEQLCQLYKSDMVGPDSNVAMRDVDYTLSTNLGTGELTANINLDENP